jgi:regulator of nucleoside diphosphate kinase
MGKFEKEGVERPPIVMRAQDRDRLFTILHDPLTAVEPEVARFLEEEIERAAIAPPHVAPDAVIGIGSDIVFIDHDDDRIRRVRLVVVPDTAQGKSHVSILSSLGGALIGLGPGQSIYWTANGRTRAVTVLEVRASDRDLRLCAAAQE